MVVISYSFVKVHLQYTSLSKPGDVYRGFEGVSLSLLTMQPKACKLISIVKINFNVKEE